MVTAYMVHSMGKRRIKSVQAHRLFRLNLIGSPGCPTVVDCFKRRWRRDQ
jgi:hypothetical protein